MSETQNSIQSATGRATPDFGADKIDGKAFAANLLQRIKQDVANLRATTGEVPGLAVVLVGEDPASAVYVASKRRETLAAGMNSFEHRLSEETTQEELLALIHRLNADPAVHGILVQLPLPGQLNADAVIDAINPAKDVDGFHVANAGRLAVGQQALVPCTPLGCVMLLKDRLGDLSGLHAVVVGRSNIVGKPMAQLLLQEDCTVTIAHRHSRDVASITRLADILVVAVGRPEMVKGDWIKPGATVIDVGINRISRDGKTRLVGDVDFAQAGHAKAITPVPGGVGPMTIGCLLENTLEAFRRAQAPTLLKSMKKGCNITDSAQFDDADTGRFFMRTSFRSEEGRTLQDLRASFAPIAEKFEMEATFFDEATKRKLMIMVSRFGHCLNDLLYRWRIGALPVDIVGVISNHLDYQKVVVNHDIPFHYIKVTKENKPAAEAEQMRIVEDAGADLIVLARYMQVLSNEMCRTYSGRIINIHHSFLPSFKGANPYKQAFERGVKLIGATSHYVTADLDEGPIIEQDIVRITHAQSPEDYVSLGRDVEAQVLSRAIHAHMHGRVFINGNKTVVFPASPGSYASERMG
ncbi:hypothetical protein Lal_00001059 [Lupinus albus]|nr:hypothetical protein Lal_00001059 [Lupinus albus]